MVNYRVVILDSSYPINSRNERIYQELTKSYTTRVITWDRTGLVTETPKGYSVFIKQAMYGKKIKKLMNFPKFYRYVKSEIKKFNPDIVIASNWDMLLIASIIKLNHKFNLIYENRDMVSSKSNTLAKVLLLIERIALKNADGMILASRFFLEHYKYYNKKKVIIENKVSDNLPIYKKVNSEKLRISFIGTVRFFDILINLIEVGKELPEVKINIYGEGPDRNRIERYIKDKGITNVKVFGQFEYVDIGKIYSQTDIVWSVYPNTESSNKKYVIPNKYFESIYFETPGIFPTNTKTGELIEKQGIGFTVNPYSREEIRQLIKSIIDGNELEEKVNNLKNTTESVLWSKNVYLLNEILDIKS